MFEKLFTPIKINKLNVKNRLVVGPMEVIYSEEDGTITDRYLKYVEERAKGGWGLIICEAHAVMEDGRAFDRCSGIWKDDQIEGERRIAEAAHKYGAKVAMQLIHGGRQTIATGAPVVGPSPIKDPTLPNSPRELTISEIKEIVSAFGEAALRAKKAGLDAVEIHGAHGYLIQEFTSPYSNKRTDEYGGSLANRARFSVEIIKDIREKVGEDFTIIYRISTTELLDEGEGLTIADSRVLAQMFEEAGVDILHCSVGNYTTIRYMLPPAAVPHAFSADFCEEIRKAVSIPVISVGRYNDPYIAEAVLKNEKADMICMARASLADPFLPNKAMSGENEDINTCIGCQIGCVGNLYKLEPIQCTVNPRTGFEFEFVDAPAENKKRVTVIGGGVGGMEAAIAAAGRGHEVTLYEKTSKLGGQWLIAAVPPYKQELANFTVWQKRQLNKMGVKVVLDTEYSKESITKDKPDAIIIATGATPITPKIPGIESEFVFQANDILSGKVLAGDSVAVIGGGEVGCETAAYLASLGKKVAIFEMLEDLAMESESSIKYFLLDYLKKKNVDCYVNAKVKELRSKALLFEKDGEEVEYENIDTIVIAIGSASENKLVKELDGTVDKVVTIGDAGRVAQGIDAIATGFREGYYI